MADLIACDPESAGFPPALHPLSDAQRERLSVLGQVSSIVAHELRNPLMIIQAALRTLRHSAMPPDQRQALTDIGAEVERLRHLVTEVLDFARPLRFDYEPTDLNALCTSAAAAAMASEPDPPIELALDDQLMTIITDPERLRAVLVNLLTNARDAVRERNDRGLGHGDGQDGPPIELRTASLPGDCVKIVVRDRGVGIGPADLDRVTEPYYTTKRTGTGLGLPIAKMLVAGLDGTLAMASERGVGTEVQIELPGQPKVAMLASPLCSEASHCDLFTTSLQQLRATRR